MDRAFSPPGGSILITSAPRSAISLPQNWPFSSASSSTRRPTKGPVWEDADRAWGWEAPATARSVGEATGGFDSDSAMCG